MLFQDKVKLGDTEWAYEKVVEGGEGALNMNKNIYTFKNQSQMHGDLHIC